MVEDITKYVTHDKDDGLEFEYTNPVVELVPQDKATQEQIIKAKFVGKIITHQFRNQWDKSAEKYGAEFDRLYEMTIPKLAILASLYD